MLITLTTDVPCHLWLHWTDKPMRIHNDPVWWRGIALPSHPRYCFVEWERVEQDEPGDTLLHHFSFSGWSTCQHRWWIFIGISSSATRYWEPWGDTLTQYHPWEVEDGSGQTGYTVKPGELYLFQQLPLHASIKVALPPGEYPLVDALDQHLLYGAHHDGALIAPLGSAVVCGPRCRKGDDFAQLEYFVARPFIGPPDLPGWGGDDYRAYFDFCEGFQCRDIVTDFQYQRWQADKDQDPTGWYVDFVQITVEGYDPDILTRVYNYFTHLHRPSRSPSSSPIMNAHFQTFIKDESMRHLDLTDKELAGVIDHADGSIAPAKMAPGFTWPFFPETPAAPPTADYEVSNKKYVDDSIPAAAPQWEECQMMTYQPPAPGVWHTITLPGWWPADVLFLDVQLENWDPGNTRNLGVREVGSGLDRRTGMFPETMVNWRVKVNPGQQFQVYAQDNTTGWFRLIGRYR